MVELLLLRHAETDWNVSGRIQGRADPPVTATARAGLERRQLPERFAGFEWVCSPLRRARETAVSLGARSPRLEPRLVEMDWGDWEGFTLAELRRTHGARMQQNESRGLDFRPDGGESPREVRERLRGWLQEVLSAGRPHVAVTHKGVIRCALTLATDWRMLGNPPLRLAWERAHLFQIEPPQAALHLTEPNIELVKR